MKQIRLFSLLLLMCFISVKTIAQSSYSLVKDSISIETLLKNIETSTPYRIFTEDELSFNVFVQAENENPIQLLKEVLSGSPYKVSVYEHTIFISKEKELVLYSPLLWSNDKKDEQERFDFPEQSEGSENAVSENKVYAIGNPRIKKLPEKVQLKGKVIDFKTGEPLVGVNIVLEKPYAGTATDADGNYSLTLPSGRRQIDISAFNVKPSRRQLMLFEDGILNIGLVEDAVELSEVTVLAGKSDNVKTVETGVIKLQISKIKNVPMVLGEADILRAIQTLPGVKTVGEASSGINVRGGATDQNLMLLNDGTIFNSNHLFGLFTAFNSDMISEAEIYKSSIPVQYGGRISSVLDIKGKEANKEKFTGSAGIGLVTSKLNLEIPVIKEKTSVLLSGRTTYSDWILKQLPAKSGYNEGTAGFYDMGAVISNKINDKNSLNLYGYYSHDRFSFTNKEQYEYNNLNASVKWRSLFNERLTGSFSVGLDHYDYRNAELSPKDLAYKLSFDINQVFVKSDFSYTQNAHKLSFGFKSLLYDIAPGTYEPESGKSKVKPDQLQKDKALESALYLGDQWEITPKFLIDAGIRYSVFNALGPREYNEYNPSLLPSETTIKNTVNAASGEVLKTYHGPEFRLSGRYIIQRDLSVKVGFNSMRQYIHRLSNTLIMSPTDTWKLSDANIRPQNGWQAATGLYYNSPEKDWETSAEVYYKKMNDYLDYRSGARILMNHHIETDVINTEGYAYGVELSLKKNTGKLNGWASYTYSRTFLRQNDKLILNPVNRGEWYPTDYDKPHDLKIVANYKFTQRYSFSVNMDYSTGRPITVPAGKYGDKSSPFVYYTDRNSYRIPDYFRTDVAFNIEPSHKLTVLTHSSISLGVYNVTGRKNVYSVYYLSETAKNGVDKTIRGYQMSIFGVPIPFISYNIKF